MPIVLDEFRLSYTPVPKVACTSLKSFMFEIENGWRFRAFKRNGKTQFIHQIYPTTEFAAIARRTAGYDRLLVVRDPIRRFLSAYSNRVAHHRELSLEKAGEALRAHDLPPDPSMAEFVEKLDLYRAASASINHHVQPLAVYAGTDAGYYSRIFRMSELEDFKAAVESLTGRTAAVEHLQTGGPKLSVDDLPAGALERLKDFYAADYATYGEWF